MGKIKDIIYSAPVSIGYIIQYYVFLFVWVDCVGVV